jgi:hypothetical protein
MPVSRIACKAVKGLISYHVLFTGKHINDTDEIDNPFEKMSDPPAPSYCCKYFRRIILRFLCCQDEEESVTESYAVDIIGYLEIGYT